MDSIVIIAVILFGVPILFWFMCRGYDDKPLFRWKEPGKTYISFKTFRRLYSIAPEKWDCLGADCVCYNYGEGDWVYLYMDSPLSVLRMCLYLKNKEKIEYDREETKQMEKLLKSWQKDIDEFKERRE